MSGPLRSRTALIATAACLVAGVLAAPASAVSPQAHTPGLEFLGESTLPAAMPFEGTVVGGLSSWAYDAARDVYYALSDDQGGTFTPTSTPARFYTLRVDLSDGSLGAGDVTVVDVTTLLGPDGQPFPGRSLDPEGLTLTPRRHPDHHLGGHRSSHRTVRARVRPVRPPAGRPVSARRLQPERRRDPRSPLQPWLRGGGSGSQRPVPVRRRRERDRPGRAGRQHRRPEARRGCCATTQTGRWTGSTSTRRTRSSRPARSSPSTGWWSCCR